MTPDKNGLEIENAEDSEFSGRGVGGRKYRPVFSHDQDRAVLEMSSIDPGFATSSASLPNQNDLKKIEVGKQPNVALEGNDESLPDHGGINGSQTESKLELFGFDSLVNILGLKSMAGDQIPAPSSPRDGEDVTSLVHSKARQQPM